MLKRLLVILIMIPLILVACSSEQPETVRDKNPELAVTDAPIEELTDVEPTQPESEATSAPAKDAGVSMECTLVSDQAAAPAELIEIFGVKADDWVLGPDTAAVTFVEYGDFQ